MNKEKTLEQLEIARQIVSSDTPFEYNAYGIWRNPRIGLNALRYVANGYEIRIKPQPDKFAELKKAHAEGKTIQCKYLDITEYQDLESPKWDSAVEYYRIKPEPDKWEELRKAHAEGKEIQYYDTFAKKWFITHSPSFVHGDFRLKPEPVKVPLGPEDVPPFCAVRFKLSDAPDKWWNCLSSAISGVTVCGSSKTIVCICWDRLMCEFEINRSIPITSKWNPEAWEPCYKEVEQ